MEVLWRFWCAAFGCAAFGCAAVLEFFSNASSGRDDLVGVAETFKCLRKELLRRA
jgi:hypothetical protein